MTVEEALNLLSGLAREVSMPLAGHARAQQAGQVMAEFILSAQAAERALEEESEKTAELVPEEAIEAAEE